MHRQDFEFWQLFFCLLMICDLLNSLYQTLVKQVRAHSGVFALFVDVDVGGGA